MWPFRQNADMSIDAAVDDAIALAAVEWRTFEANSGIPTTINLRDRVPHFAAAFRPLMARRFPSLRAAPEELVLLVTAEGIVASGTIPRRLVEL